MLITVQHRTLYQYSVPPKYALQQLRLRPQNSHSQKIINWDIGLEGAQRQTGFTDQHGNQVDLIQLQSGADHLSLLISGQVETFDTKGIVGPHTLSMPLWFYLRQTPLTKAGPGINGLVADMRAKFENELELLHQLSTHISLHVAYNQGTTNVATTAEEVYMQGAGVCQDHTHIFLSAARELGFPARYVSGYLMLDDRIEQDASHAWSEAYIQGLGWVGFDVSNAISPDERYVQIARGLDYSGAAPTTGFIVGAEQEKLVVSLQVQQ